MHSKTLARAVCGITISALLALAGAARAAEPPTGSPPPSTGQHEAPAGRPWAENVPESAQKDALALFEEANKLFETSQHAAALAKYREALKFWDHPAIRYNAAVALINLDQPLAANENLELALQYGPTPFSSETYQQALTYRKLLRGQLAELKVSCAESDAEVTMDGAPFFVAPGEASRWLLPGPHQIVVRKAGFLTETRSLTLLPGKPASEAVVLQAIRSVPTQTVRRWSTWTPWVVIGSGVVVGAVGVPFMLTAKSNVNAYDNWIAEACPSGCQASAVPQDVTGARDRAKTDNIVGISFFAVGGVLAASGVTMLILNQPRIVQAPTSARLSATPVLGAGTIGLSVAVEQ